MKKLFYFLLTLVLVVNTSCKKDFLDVESPSSIDEDFVFGTPDEATKVLAHLYDVWHDLDKRHFYDISSVGSDSERHPELYPSQPRHIPEGLFAEEMNINDGNAEGTWKEGFLIINRANIIMEAIEGKQEYQNAVASGTANDWTQLYGEALCHRATNFKMLIKYFGDLPYFDYSIRSATQTDTIGYTSRDVIYDKEIEALKKAVPLMYRLGENGLTAEKFSGTYGDQLIARLAFDAAGFQLRRTDLDYSPVTFEQKGTEAFGAKYVRRTDYKDYYAIAKEYYLKVVNNPGSAMLIENDERGDAFANPFQRNFQYLMDLQVSPESLFECGYTRTQNSDFPYSFGRPSGGGGSNNYPNKCYGQGRIVTSFYFGEYDPADKRRDVTACITANSGAASERLINFSPGSREKGGLANNKLDEARMADPYIPRQRQSGVNWQQVRMANVMLNLAYASAITGDEATAKTYFKKVRNRAFWPSDRPTKVEAYVNAMSGEDLLKGIEQELKLELAGEGLTRWDAILFGTLPERIQKMRDTQRAMVEGLKNDGYYTFENGVQISSQIYTKKVSVKDFDPSLSILTTQTPQGLDESDPRYPVLVPGWRGTSNLWEDIIEEKLPNNKVHIAIRGLYRYIDPASAEGLALLADGYELTDWGNNIVANEGHYTDDLFKGYPDGSAANGLPPRYILPLSQTTLATSNGNFTQGYGHASE